MTSQSVLIGGGASAFRLKSGTTEVFLAVVNAGVPYGERVHLFSAKAGDLLFGCKSSVEGEPVPFVVVSKPQDLESVAPEQEAEHIWGAANERWIENLGRCVADEYRFQGSAVSLLVGQACRLQDGQAARSNAMAPVWVLVQAGAVRLFGAEEAQLPAGPEPYPLPSGAWMTGVGEARVTVVSTPTLDRRTCRQALDHCQMALQSLLSVTLKRRSAEEVVRRERRQEIERRQRASVQRVVARSIGALPPKRTEPSSLTTIAEQLGHSLNCQIVVPERLLGETVSHAGLMELVRHNRLRHRRVTLKGNWYRNDCGPLICSDAHAVGAFSTCVLTWTGTSYVGVGPETEERFTVNSGTASRIQTHALSLFPPLPHEQLSLWYLVLQTLRRYRREFAMLLGLQLIATLLGMLLPMASRSIVDSAIPDAATGFLWQLFVVLVAAYLLQSILVMAEAFITLRIQEGGTMLVQSAVFDRLLRLPTHFFRLYASGDILNRAMMVTELSHRVGSSGLRAILGGLLASMNLALLIYYHAPLAMMALVTGVGAVAVSSATTLATRRIAIRGEEIEGKLFGFVVQLVNGVAKLRISGAVGRAINAWSGRYAEQMKCDAAVMRLHDAATLFNSTLPSVASILVYAVILMSVLQPKDHIPMSLGTLVAFQAAFMLFLGGLLGFSQTIVDMADALSKLRLVAPLLQYPVESDQHRADPGILTGMIKLQRVSFRYSPQGPLTLSSVSIDAAPGEFIALVGPSGSGKSTILRLILGFEQPESGCVLFDGQNLQGLDLGSVRRQMGVVLQAAKIAAGSIYDNIAYGNIVSMDEAWQAARDAGLADDLKAMPMGLHTVVSEGGVNLSGGQRQRLLIARALASSPRVILFDEATSALDNITQATVSASLSRRQVTRIVIAHRLSTIINADRIYVLDAGRVVETGTYKELLARGGTFQQLAARQIR
jgi:NHLM bacteriocin system ABC transporter ATP-binding protein